MNMVSTTKQQQQFAVSGSSDAYKALMAVLETGSSLSGEVSDALAAFDIGLSQYHLLRVLAITHPVPLTCTEISCRLLDRTPDVTRMLNRLESRGLIVRKRSIEDRRVVEVCASGEGLELYEEMQALVSDFEARLEQRLSNRDLATLNALLDKLRRRRAPRL